MVPGLMQRARAKQEIIADIYGEQHLLNKFPSWRKILENHPGFWPEFVGWDSASRRKILTDNYAAGLHGPDMAWLVQRDAEGRRMKDALVVVEENGANVGGAEFLTGVVEQFKQHPEWGAVPFNDDLFKRYAEHMHTLASVHYAHSSPKVTVVADEASAGDSPVSVTLPDGTVISVKPTFPVGAPFLNFVREKFAAVGIEYVSLVDERGRLFVDEHKVLWLRDRVGDGKRKVDVLWTLADLESVDPSHHPQWDRNIKAHKADLNENAMMLGIPGLISSWLSDHFIWISNPTSAFTRTKLAPVMIDDYIRATTNAEPLLPSIPTTVFFDQEGNFNAAALRKVRSNPRDFVFKLALGDGGAQVTIAKELSDADLSAYLVQFEEWARANPMSVIAQPFMELGRVSLDWPKAEQDGFERQERVFDSRMISMISGSGPTFTFTPNRHVLMRLAPPGKLKVNMKGGGAGAIGTPAPISHVEVLPPLADIGIRQMTIPYQVRQGTLDRIQTDAGNRALTEAEILRETIRRPQNIVRDIPEMAYLMNASNFYYRDDYFRDRNSPYDVIFLSGADYMELESGESVVVEHNTTNVGGMFRLWRLRMPEVINEMRRWFANLRGTDRGEKPYSVYLLEAGNYGTPWEQMRAEFKADFQMELASADEITRFQVRSDKLYYRDDSDKEHQVTTLFLHIEPDLIDPQSLPPNLNGAVDEHELAEKMRHAIPGLHQVIKKGNLQVMNEPGVDFSCCKALLPWMPQFQDRYLKRIELVRTQPTYSFLDPTGNLNRSQFEIVKRRPQDFVVKDVLSIGNGGGVSILRTMGEGQRLNLYDAIESEPSRFVVQEVGNAKVNELGFHVETRFITLVRVNLNSDAPAEIIGQIPVPYGRAANQRDRANALPSGDGVPASRVPIVEECRREIIRLSSGTYQP